jgi:hypothetical protein
MTDTDDRDCERQGGNLLPWFWAGAGLGLVFAAGVTIMVAELTRRRYFTGNPAIDSEVDLVDDLTAAIHEGLYVLTEVADQLVGRDKFSDANQERIRYGLDPSGAGAGSSGWYTGDEDEE